MDTNRWTHIFENDMNAIGLSDAHAEALGKRCRIVRSISPPNDGMDLGQMYEVISETGLELTAFKHELTPIRAPSRSSH